MAIEKKDKKALLTLLKRMLASGEYSGRYVDLKPDEGAYLQTEWTITIEKDMKRV